MPKGRKKKKHQKPAEISEAAEKKARRDAAFKRNRRYILPLILNTIVFFGLYSFLVDVSPSVMMVTLWVYFALTAGFCFAYVIYNRGFSRMNLTPDMLPDSMSTEEKAAFIEDGKDRIEKSKWMITIIFPLLMTFILDIVYMYIIEPMFELASSMALVTVITTVFSL